MEGQPMTLPVNERLNSIRNRTGVLKVAAEKLADTIVNPESRTWALRQISRHLSDVEHTVLPFALEASSGFWAWRWLDIADFQLHLAAGRIKEVQGAVEKYGPTFELAGL
jgi:hypothetical protein